MNLWSGAGSEPLTSGLKPIFIWSRLLADKSIRDRSNAIKGEKQEENPRVIFRAEYKEFTSWVWQMVKLSLCQHG